MGAVVMTPEQEQLVADNVDYVRRLARSRFPHDDEYESVAIEALVKAARTYTPGVLRFEVYVFGKVRAAMFDFYRHTVRPRWSFQPLSSVDRLAGDDRDVAELVAERVDAARLLDEVRSPLVLARAQLVADGYRQADVARIHAVTPTSVANGFRSEEARLAVAIDKFGREPLPRYATRGARHWSHRGEPWS
jgi:DNA-directed RNA polymerase specialized sigma24 family protein